MDKILAARNEYREQQWALVIKECAKGGRLLSGYLITKSQGIISE